MTEMTVRAFGVKEAEAELRRIEIGVGDTRLLPIMKAAAGLVHRYLMGLSRDMPPLDEQGVLPVITGRLKNSFFFDSGRMAGATIGFVRSTIIYGPPVEARRRFLAKTAKDTEKPVNDFVATYIAGVVR